MSKVLVESSGADVVEWWIRQGKGFLHCQVRGGDPAGGRWDVNHIDVVDPERGLVVGTRGCESTIDLLEEVLESRPDTEDVFLTPGGVLIAVDARREMAYRVRETGEFRVWRPDPEHEFSSLMLIPLLGQNENVGFVQLKSRQKGRFAPEQGDFYETAAEALALSLVSHGTQLKLRERIKELGCLYEVVRLAGEPRLTVEAVLAGISEIIPSAWQYPEITAARIEFDGRAYCSRGFRETPWSQSAEIHLARQSRGRIYVVYLEERPQVFEGPFLQEERHLLDALALEISGIVDRRQVGEEMARLEDQLRHADRLATLGELAAGVAHELNEPLGAILGFAQLAEKCEGLPGAAREDLRKIGEACLQSRAIVSKLRLFARQMPPEGKATDLNKIIKDGLFFLRSRCARQSIRIVEELDSKLPSIVADQGQLHQVLVNLVVNAVQAMPQGGVLTIRTGGTGNGVVLAVEDTGAGMSRDVVERIFQPFFTTKDAGEGTGLGLSIVHRIVTAHGGTIEVQSETGCGTRFEVRLPSVTEEPFPGRDALP